MALDGTLGELKARIAHLEIELSQRNKVIQDLNRRVQESNDSSQPTPEINEIEETLRRLMTRIGMIVQGTKCLLMVHDPETNDLIAERPALGLDESNLDGLRIATTDGLSGHVFTSGAPAIMYDAVTDEFGSKEIFSQIGVRNGVCVPLIVEKRDEETNKVVDRKTIGVLHVFNQRFGGVFTDEDVALLERMSRNAAAVINTATTFRRVVEEKRELEEQINALSIGLVMIGKNERVSQMNASARQILGIALDESLHNRPMDTVVTNEDVVKLLRTATTSDIEITDEISIAEPGAPENLHTFQVQSAAVNNESGERLGTVAIFNDITAIKNVDKMKTAFVSTVSHELRTPMTSIKGFVSTLLMDEDGTMFDHTDRIEFYGIIDKECDRLRRLIDDLLNVSRIEAGASMQLVFDTVDIPEVLKKTITIENGSTYKRENHTISFEAEPDVPQIIDADPDKFEQILHNLIGNALKYSPDGGAVKVKASMVPGNEFVQFAISDQGLGMSPEFLKKFGEKFARADNRDTRSINGTGIGVFLVRNFVEGHGGTMWPDSEGIGKGTTITFTMPVKQTGDFAANLSSRVAG
ncbi:MAG: ATP-binding protein [Armatimonadaceae bacterium]